ncbi:MAG: hypothetical protein DYH02_04070 [Candidatus Omnitrophica bacterium COP1]|nr:hypothetical protein [Candidatus Omnitrophica bacterium COP1]
MGAILEGMLRYIYAAWRTKIGLQGAKIGEKNIPFFRMASISALLYCGYKKFRSRINLFFIWYRDCAYNNSVLGRNLQSAGCVKENRAKETTYILPLTARRK